MRLIPDLGGVSSTLLILRHATGSLGILESPLHEMPCHPYVSQPAQAGLGLGIGQAELQLRSTDLPAYRKMPAARPLLGAIPLPHAPTQAIGDNFAFSPSRTDSLRQRDAGRAAARAVTAGGRVCARKRPGVLPLAD